MHNPDQDPSRFNPANIRRFAVGTLAPALAVLAIGDVASASGSTVHELPDALSAGLLYDTGLSGTSGTSDGSGETGVTGSTTTSTTPNPIHKVHGINVEAVTYGLANYSFTKPKVKGRVIQVEVGIGESHESKDGVNVQWIQEPNGWDVMTVKLSRGVKLDYLGGKTLNGHSVYPIATDVTTTKAGGITVEYDDTVTDGWALESFSANAEPRAKKKV
jgi:hypothetical protein